MNDAVGRLGYAEWTVSCVEHRLESLESLATVLLWKPYNSDGTAVVQDVYGLRHCRLAAVRASAPPQSRLELE